MNLNIMIVDDSLIMVQKLGIIVRELGCQVLRTYNTGADAVREYPHVKPDLVMMDITMPGMDGIEATQKIVAADPRARVIMVTSHGQQGMVVRALEAGALGYVLKPVTKERLQAMIDRAMKQVVSQTVRI
jgi:two-component system, chemotaxis family, chemotaxis protein CheY